MLDGKMFTGKDSYAIAKTAIENAQVALQFIGDLTYEVGESKERVEDLEKSEGLEKVEDLEMEGEVTSYGLDYCKESLELALKYLEAPAEDLEADLKVRGNIVGNLSVVAGAAIFGVFNVEDAKRSLDMSIIASKYNKRDSVKEQASIVSALSVQRKLGEVKK